MGDAPYPRKALFLDRDGVVNVDKDYLYRIEDFEFIDGIFELCHHAQARGLVLVIITNQSGIARGYYTEQDFHALTEWMLARLHEQDIGVAKVYYCPYHAEHGVGEYQRESFDRKPNPGMILKARDELELDLGASILIGDKASDMEAGRRAGVGCKVFIRGAAPDAQGEAKADVVLDSVREAAEWLAALRR